jgi:hypothetical protein
MPAGMAASATHAQASSCGINTRVRIGPRRLLVAEAEAAAHALTCSLVSESSRSRAASRSAS